MDSLEHYLESSSALHRHLCPRQVLGVRMGLLAAKLLSMAMPQNDKRLLTIAETDGCFVDGISAVTNCAVGHRTLRIEDCGKIAATFVDTETPRRIRLIPQETIRTLAYEFAPGVSSKWQAQLLGYQRIPDEQLFHIQDIELLIPIEKMVSKAGRKVICQQCGEEIINEREAILNGQILCKPCAGSSYYRLREDGHAFAVEPTEDWAIR